LNLRIIIEEKMKNPSHPGEVFYWGVLEPLNISISQAARALGIRRATLSAVVKAKAALSPDLALRIEKALDRRSISCCGFRRPMMQHKSVSGRKV
jgi:addiction module HigA family antidote